MENTNQKKILRQLLTSRYGNFDHWWLLFLVWPFGAMAKAVYYFRNPKAKNIVWLFLVFFGFVFVYADPFGMGGADSARYARNLIDLHQDWYSFDYLSTMFYSDEGTVDLYEPLVTWIVAFFTGNPRWLFTVFAAVFGWFYVQNLWMVFDKIDKRKKIDFVLLLFMVAFALVNPIWNINGVRMWTAAQVFIFGAFKYILDKDKKGIIWILTSILFHFSFFVPAAIFLIYLFVPKNTTMIWLLVFFASSLVRELDLSAVRNAMTFLPDFLQPRVTSYVGEQYVEKVLESKDNFGWHVKFAEMSGRYILYAWILIVYLKGKEWLKLHPSVNRLFLLGLFLGTFAQILSNIPSGGRYMTLVSMIFYAVFVLFVSDNRMDSKVYLYKYITMPFILFMVIFKIRIGFDYIGISAFFSNPLLALFVEDSTPVIDFVKKIF